MVSTMGCYKILPLGGINTYSQDFLDENPTSEFTCISLSSVYFRFNKLPVLPASVLLLNSFLFKDKNLVTAASG